MFAISEMFSICSFHFLWNVQLWTNGTSASELISDHGCVVYFPAPIFPYALFPPSFPPILPTCVTWWSNQEDGDMTANGLTPSERWNHMGSQLYHIADTYKTLKRRYLWIMMMPTTTPMMMMTISRRVTVGMKLQCVTLVNKRSWEGQPEGCNH